MKSTFKLFLAMGFILFLSGVGFAQEQFSVISANGFSCSQSNQMVTCRGSFPESKIPVIEATGYNVIWIRGEYPGKRYTYFSDSGCLCQAEFKGGGKVKKEVCTSRFGHVKKFKGKKDSYKWCKNN